MRCCLQGVLADGALVELVLDKLLNRYLLMSLRASLNEVESVFKSKQVRERPAVIYRIYSVWPGADWTGQKT